MITLGGEGKWQQELYKIVKSLPKREMELLSKIEKSKKQQKKHSLET